MKLANKYLRVVNKVTKYPSRRDYFLSIKTSSAKYFSSTSFTTLPLSLSLSPIFTHTHTYNTYIYLYIAINLIYFFCTYLYRKKLKLCENIYLRSKQFIRVLDKMPTQLIFIECNVSL